MHVGIFFRNMLDILRRVPLMLVGNKSDLHMQRYVSIAVSCCGVVE